MTGSGVPYYTPSYDDESLHVLQNDDYNQLLQQQQLQVQLQQQQQQQQQTTHEYHQNYHSPSVHRHIPIPQQQTLQQTYEYNNAMSANMTYNTHFNNNKDSNFGENSDYSEECQLGFNLGSNITNEFHSNSQSWDVGDLCREFSTTCHFSEKEREFSSRDNVAGDERSWVLCMLGLPNGTSHYSGSGLGSVSDTDEWSGQAVNSVQHLYACDKDFRPVTRGDRILPEYLRISYSWAICRWDIHGFSGSLTSIYESLKPSAEEKSKQKQLIAILEKLVCNEWPNAKLYLYGSCVNSFGLPNSDIDVCLAIEDRYINKSEMLLTLADYLQYNNFENVQALTRARVPIVKLMDSVTGISCDICINNFRAVINTKLLQNYAEIDVRLRQLVLLVKHWAKCRGINDAYQGTLSSYTYVLMCIHFLQQRDPPILPCLQGMRTTYAVTVDYTEYGFFDQVGELRHFGARNTENIAWLMWEFFRYWAYCHDYANTVISVRTGNILSKHEKGWTRSIGNDRHLISIEDPIDTTHDLGRVVNQNSIRVLREEFERAAWIMQCDPNPCVSLFEPYVPS